MKAIVLRDNALFTEQVADPTPEPGQLLVANRACGVCGSDLHLVEHHKRITNAFGSGQDIGNGLIMGHEFCAEVMETDGDFKAGQLVTSVPLLIKDGRYAKGIGLTLGIPGGWSEYFALQRDLVLKVPDGLDAVTASFTEPLSVGYHAVAIGEVTTDDVALVVGCGPVGLAVIVSLKQRGIEVVAADFSAERRKLAELCGADHTCDPQAHSPYQAWVDLATPEGYEPDSLEAMLDLGPQPKPTVAFECVGRPGILDMIMQNGMKHARIVSVGACMERDSFEPLAACTKEMVLRFSFGYSPEEFQQSLTLIADGKVPEAFFDHTIGDLDQHHAIEARVTDKTLSKFIVQA